MATALFLPAMKRISGSAKRPAHHSSNVESTLAPLAGSSAKRPAHHSAGSSAELPARHSSNVECTMASLATHNLSRSAQQLAVLQCLEREGWLVAPLLNGCRVAVLSRACKQTLEGWPNRLECLECLKLCRNDLVARKLQWVAHHCPQLRYLSLYSRIPDGRNLTQAIQAIAGGCSRLRHLDSGGNSLSNALIETVAQACPHLECLCLADCDVTDAALRAVAQRCPHLKKLDVSENRVSNAAIRTVAQACPQLECLCLAACGVTDAALWAVAQSCPQLKELNVSLNRVSNATIQAVAKGCPQLKKLNVIGCPMLTESAILSIVQSCPHVRILRL